MQCFPSNMPHTSHYPPEYVFERLLNTNFTKELDKDIGWQPGKCFNCWNKSRRFGNQLYTAHLHWWLSAKSQIPHLDLTQRDHALPDFINKHLIKYIQEQRQRLTKTSSYPLSLCLTIILISFLTTAVKCLAELFSPWPPWEPPLKLWEHIWILLFKTYATNSLKLAPSIAVVQ